jgi:hypothetical protein
MVVDTLNAAKTLETPANGQKHAFLNLGCGKTHFPTDVKPPGHDLVSLAVYQYPDWLNVDKVEGVGADKIFDLFQYPWPLDSDSYDGALCSHIVEHIPHEITAVEPDWEYLDQPIDFMRAFQKWRQITKELKATRQEGSYAFYAELYRVLTNGSLIHILAPYGWSDGAITDPSHTRLLTINTFTHSMSPAVSDGPTFRYNNGGINLQLLSYSYHPSPMYQHLVSAPSDSPDVQAYKQALLQQAMMHQLNVVQDIYVQMRVVK